METKTVTSVVAVLGCLLLPRLTATEPGVLVVHVADVKGTPIPGVQIATRGDGGSAVTDTSGRARIPLAAQTKPAAVVALTIVRAPKELVFISPWDNHVRVPPFDNESSNFVSIVVAERGDRTLIESGRALTALISRINQQAGPRDAVASTAQRRSEALRETAESFGLPIGEVDAASRRLAESAKDEYEAGMAALYAGDLPDATARLEAALAAREAKLDLRKRDAADAAFFLAQAYYRQGSYPQAVATYRKALSYRPGDPAITNNLGLALLQAGEFAAARTALQQALGALELAGGSNSPELVFTLNNLAALLTTERKLPEAEQHVRRGLAIREQALGANDPRTANSLNNLATILLLENDLDAAAPLLARAEAILTDATGRGARGRGVEPPTRTGPEQPAIPAGGALSTPGITAVRLNQATLARRRGDLARARQIAENALLVLVRTYGASHPEVANGRLCLAQVELASREYPAAAEEFARALAAYETVFGGTHPALVDALVGLGEASEGQKNRSAATSAYERARAIRERHFGSADPVALDLIKRLNALRQGAFERGLR